MATKVTAPGPMSAEQAAALTEFARTVKTAARAVSLYPATHPAIQGALGRVVAASRRLTAGGDVGPREAGQRDAVRQRSRPRRRAVFLAV